MTWALTHLRLILLLIATVTAFALGVGVGSFWVNARWQAEQLRIASEKIATGKAQKAEQKKTDALGAALDAKLATQETKQKAIEKEVNDETHSQVIYSQCKPTPRLVRSINAAVDNY